MNKKPRYNEKFTLDTGTVVYKYDKSEIDKRKRKKVSHCKNISKTIPEIIKIVSRDIDRGIDEALVTGVILCTYERVGNETSADNGHYGASNLERRHIADCGNYLTVCYVAKSGVEQFKSITEPSLVKHIKNRIAKLRPRDRIFTCTALQVNGYLDKFGITSKDIRTFAANKFMEEELIINGINKARTKRERQEIFKKSLEVVARIIGHKPATLKSMYLHDKLKDKYLG